MYHKQRKMGTIVRIIQRVISANFLYNMVKTIVNMGNALAPSYF